MSRHNVLPWRWQKQIPPKYYYLSVKLYSSNFLENTNPGWLTPIILCTCEVHSLRSADVCVCVVSVHLYCLLHQYPMSRARGTFKKWESIIPHWCGWSPMHTSLHLDAMVVVQNIRLVSYDLYRSWNSDLL